MSLTLPSSASQFQIQDLSQSLALPSIIVRARMFVVVYLILTPRTAQGNYPNSRSPSAPAGECHRLLSRHF